MKKCLSTSNSGQVCLSSQNDKRNTEIQQTEHKPSFVVALLSTTRRCNRLLFVFGFHILFKLLSSFKVLDAFLSNTFFRFISLGFIYRIEPKISLQLQNIFLWYATLQVYFLIIYCQEFTDEAYVASTFPNRPFQGFF